VRSLERPWPKEIWNCSVMALRAETLRSGLRENLLTSLESYHSQAATLHSCTAAWPLCAPGPCQCSTPRARCNRGVGKWSGELLD